MENTFIILQARLSSTRLPRKLLLPLSGLSIFEHILQRLVLATIPCGIIVATTEDTVSSIALTAERYKAHLWVGSEQDVLSRYVDAVNAYNVHTVVRATGDNPLVCIEYIDKAILLHRDRSADLTTFPLLPYGTGIEVISGRVLKTVARKTANPFEREHITQYIYRNESNFSVVREKPDVPMQRPEIRLTVDTPDDYRKMKAIYASLYKNKPIRLKEVIAYLDSGGFCV